MQFLCKRQWLKDYGICFMRRRSLSEYFIFVPFLLMPVLNLKIYGIDIPVCGILWMIFYSSMEEVLYRGILLSMFTGKYTRNILSGIVLTSFFFALMHIVNIYAGAAAFYVLIQGICAGLTGGCLAILTCCKHSIIPGIVIHSLINVTSLGNDGRLDLSGKHALLFIMSAMMYLVYAIWMYQREK